MKAIPTLLVCSLAANAALVGLVLSRPDLVTEAASSFRAAKPAAQVVAGSKAQSPKAAQGADTWSKFDGQSLSEVIARLKAAGFPDSVVRAIGWSLLREKYRTQENALLADVKPPPYWKPGWRVVPKDIQPQLTALMRAEQAEAKSLGLPSDADENAVSRLYKARQYGDLSKEAISKIEKVQADYADMESQLHNDDGMILTKDQVAKMNYLEKQKQADLAQVLSPDELETYLLHTSQTSNSLKNQLRYFDASESEFKAIFDAQQAAGNPQGMMYAGAPTQEQLQQRQQQQAAADQQIAAALGPDRFAEYQKDTNPIYIQTANTLSSLGLPSSTIDQVYSTSKTAQDQIAALRRDSSLSAGDRNSQINDIGAQATAALTTLLGNENFTTYKQQAGWWLNNLPRARASR